ncbi:hypothetical protein [Sporosarcina gallistercoris]|uniref:DUF5590 domain-containing protein n=1 Tax=Sporosarcina gallistercoris TaxID=2762245 RepID=A0ABR8PIW0_9BACL|nr:hypothetical protein [Sporosarcina gallistercoris]MBD7908132.1 hypothetical protein [Sporosarcina gallistercoris]
MYKFFKITLIVLGVIIFGIAVLVFSFIQSMKPDKDKEEEVKVQAEKYLKDNFNSNFVIYDTLFDNMGNFGFEYAAKVRDTVTETQFLVYYDDEKNHMVDTYIAEKWAKDLEKEISLFIEENLEDSTDLYVFFDDKIGNEFGIDPNNPRNYKDFDVEPTIRIRVPRKKSDEDEKIINEFVTLLKSEAELQHGSVVMEYIAENGVILDDEWWKDF